MNYVILLGRRNDRSHESQNKRLQRSLKSVYGRQMGQGQEMTLTLINHIPSFTPSVLYFTTFQVSGYNSFQKIHSFHFSHVKANVSKIDLALK